LNPVQMPPPGVTPLVLPKDPVHGVESARVQRMLRTSMFNQDPRTEPDPTRSGRRESQRGTIFMQDAWEQEQHNRPGIGPPVDIWEQQLAARPVSNSRPSGVPCASPHPQQALRTGSTERQDQKMSVHPSVLARSYSREMDRYDPVPTNSTMPASLISHSASREQVEPLPCSSPKAPNTRPQHPLVNRQSSTENLEVQSPILQNQTSSRGYADSTITALQGKAISRNQFANGMSSPVRPGPEKYCAKVRPQSPQMRSPSPKVSPGFGNVEGLKKDPKFSCPQEMRRTPVPVARANSDCTSNGGRSPIGGAAVAGSFRDNSHPHPGVAIGSTDMRANATPPLTQVTSRTLDASTSQQWDNDMCIPESISVINEDSTVSLTQDRTINPEMVVGGLLPPAGNDDITDGLLNRLLTASSIRNDAGAGVQRILDNVINHENRYLKKNVDHLRRSKHSLEDKVAALEQRNAFLEDQVQQLKAVVGGTSTEALGEAPELEIRNLHAQLHAIQLLKEALNCENVELHHRLKTSQTAEANELRRAACVICMDNLANTVCLPCKHLSLCLPCGEQKGVTQCPICRADIKEKMQIYTP